MAQRLCRECCSAASKAIAAKAVHRSVRRWQRHPAAPLRRLRMRGLHVYTSKSDVMGTDLQSIQDSCRLRTGQGKIYKKLRSSKTDVSRTNACFGLSKADVHRTNAGYGASAVGDYGIDSEVLLWWRSYGRTSRCPKAQGQHDHWRCSRCVFLD